MLDSTFLIQEDTNVNEKDIKDVNEYILDWFNNNGSLF